MGDAKFIRNPHVWNRYFGLPREITKDVEEQLKKEAEDLTEQIKANAPVATELENHPGELRDAVRFYKNPRRPLSFIIVCDPKDEQGRIYSMWVEFGHRMLGGIMVAARAFFFPTYRLRRKAIRRRVFAAGRKAVKAFMKG